MEKKLIKLINKYVHSGNIICFNCGKKIEKGLMSWCSFKCRCEFKKKYNLKTTKEVSDKVFELMEKEFLSSLDSQQVSKLNHPADTPEEQPCSEDGKE